MNSLEHYYTSIYDEADIYSAWRIFILSLLFISLGCSVYTQGIWLYVSAFSVILFQIIVWVLKIKINNLNTLAHNFQKYALLTKVFSNAFDANEISDLKRQVSLYVSKKAKEKEDEGISSVEYTKFQNISNIKKLQMMIHENSYFNHYLYEKTYKRNFYISLILILISIIPLVYLAPLIKLDSDLSIPRLVFSLLSFTLIYEFIENTYNYKKTSQAMKNIDSYLYQNSSLNDNVITEIFSRYNEAKLITPNIPNSIYKKYETRINESWNERAKY
ncbi:MAG: hypothetical protein PHI02_05470 [Sulfurovaceae bacterium]|nr:hypothetical protein [Sulfurovaceae bacterium]